MNEKLRLCTCSFVMANIAMNNKGCEVHDQLEYKCDECNCLNYRPRSKPTNQNGGKFGGWPVCNCGHAAQSHN